jgi:hypothetical protein
MSSCWEVLDIVQTTDLKQIRFAYASKLKNTRPDEKPSEFQQLHQAYKYALNHAKHVIFEQEQQESKNTQKADTNNISTESESQSSNKISLNDSNEAVQEAHEQEKYRLHVESEYNKLIENFNIVLNNQNKRNDKSDWLFLTQSQLILDPQINSQLGLFILNAVDQHNLAVKAPSANKRSGRKRSYSEPNAKVNDRILKHLNSIFNWSGQLHMVNYYLGEELCNRLIPVLEQQNLNNQQAAINSVKGGLVNRQKEKLNSMTEYNFITDAYENVVKMTGFITFILVIISLPAIMGLVNRDNTIGAALLTTGSIYLIIQWYGLRKQIKCAYKSMWVFSSILLIGFPIGTIYGVLLMVNLYKSRRFHDF